MALIYCPECGKEISDMSETCINCGYVIHPEKQKQKKRKKVILFFCITLALLLALGGVFLLKSNKEAITYTNSKVAFSKLNDSASILSRAMSDIYIAWKWGIYDFDDYATCSTNAERLQKEVSINLELGAGEDSSPGAYLVYYAWIDSEWQGCIDLVVDSYEASGLYQEVEALLNEAQAALKTVSESNADYQYYPSLKQYYSKLQAMFEFVKSPTGSFEQLKTTMNNYSTDIRTFQGDLSFVFAD